MYSVTVRRSFTAPRGRVFDAFQNADALSHWFAPSAEVTIEILTFQFRPNGEYRFRYTYPDNTQGVIGGRYISINPPEELVFSWIWEQPDRHADVATQVRIQFISRNELTDLIVTHDRLPSDQARDRYATGWSGNFDRLDTWLSPNKSPE